MSVQAASIQQYRGIKKRLRRAAKRTSPPTKTFVFYSRRHLRMNLAHDATVGERRMGNKKFPTRTKTYHGDVHLREGMSDLRTLVDRTAEALENAVDVVERPHVPRSAVLLDRSGLDRHYSYAYERLVSSLRVTPLLKDD